MITTTAAAVECLLMHWILYVYIFFIYTSLVPSTPKTSHGIIIIILSKSLLIIIYYIMVRTRRRSEGTLLVFRRKLIIVLHAAECNDIVRLIIEIQIFSERRKNTFKIIVRFVNQYNVNTNDYIWDIITVRVLLLSRTFLHGKQKSKLLPNNIVTS